MLKNFKSFVFVLAAFLFVTNAAYSANNAVLLKTTSSWDGVKYKKINISNPEVTVLKITIDVGETLPAHKHNVLNVAYVQKGTLTIVTDKNEQVTFSEGNCLPETIGKYHTVKNAGSEPVELIVFSLGKKGAPFSINKK